MRRAAACLVVIFVALLSERARADDPSLAFFEARIRPVLVEHCYQCHSADSRKLGGGLRLDSREGLRKGGESGAVIEPGKPGSSLLVKAVRYTDEALRMPPKGKLPASAVADLETWIQAGAPDPRDASARAGSTETWAEVFRRRSDWWSLKPLQKAAVPSPERASECNDPMDRFIVAGLEKQGLTPAEAADPRTLARRLSLVLTGLPLDAQRLNQFLAEWGETSTGGSASAAVVKLVDALLASPHFGERWARHWMDVVRFSETHGNEWNYEVHHAWRYRDYLVRAFNADLPYDQFIREHIAGDLLPDPRGDAIEGFNESVIGTGFYRFGEVNHDDCISLRQIGYDLADNQVDTLTKAFQATTVACARCHDHKLDAVSTADYYALLGVVRSSRMVSHDIDPPDLDAPARARLHRLKSDLRKAFAATWLGETHDFAQFMKAAQARRAGRTDLGQVDTNRLERWVAILAAESTTPDDPFDPWRSLVRAPADDRAFPENWRSLAIRIATEDHARTEFNQTRFVTLADFRKGKDAEGWQVGGLGLLDPPGRAGDFVMQHDGDVVIRSLLPAGRFTHVLSDRLNGTLRSPVLPTGRAFISFEVQGRHGSAARLVSNNCQLNYKNYQALTSDDLHWVTFSPPADRESLRTYAELMTMFDNPKFPDQLSALGGDAANYRLPWEKAAEDPRSSFGITREVLHDAPEPPKPEMSHLRRLFEGDEPRTIDDVLERYARLAEAVVLAWLDDRASDDDVRWLDAFLRRGVIGNTLSKSPEWLALVKEYRAVESALALPRVIVGVSDGGPGIRQPIFVRGDCARPGDPVPRRYLDVLSGSSSPFQAEGSGRLELADRIASAENPLTARVMVNRIWHHVFGTGLVRTVDDFGHAGEAPSHPELLDDLAARFIDDGWSVKRLIRALVLSRTFQQSARPSAEARERDPENRLLQHYPARRMEAEAVRDSILAASGRLDSRLYGMSIQPARDKEYADRRLFPGPLDGNGRRSLYIKNNLMESPRFLAAFDLPGGKVARGRRDLTNVPAQALTLLNDPFVHQQTDVWAGRLLARADHSAADRIAAMFETALGRPPTAVEQDRLGRAVIELADLHGVKPSGVLSSRIVWSDLAHALMNFSEFLYIP